MDANHADWYVRHNGSHLSVESENDTVNLPQFQLDSSFIMHSDKFYQGYYALESLSFPYWYIKALSDGHLGIVQQDITTDYYDTASFGVYDYNTSGTNVSLLYCAYFVSKYKYMFFVFPKSRSTTQPRRLFFSRFICWCILVELVYTIIY